MSASGPSGPLVESWNTNTDIYKGITAIMHSQPKTDGLVINHNLKNLKLMQDFFLNIELTYMYVVYITQTWVVFFF